MWWARLLNVISGLLSGGAAPIAATSYESIATGSGNGSSGNITFSSIPSTFKHLQIRFIAKDTYSGSAGPSNMRLQFNSDSTEANYYYHYLRGNGSSASASAGNSNAFNGSITDSYDDANLMGVGVIDILDYASTSKYKTVRILNGVDYNGSGNVQLYSMLWNNTGAISTLNFYNATGWATKTQFALYGIKG